LFLVGFVLAKVNETTIGQTCCGNRGKAFDAAVPLVEEILRFFLFEDMFDREDIDRSFDGCESVCLTELTRFNCCWSGRDDTCNSRTSSAQGREGFEKNK
jgi:hypothetical protein|tara:strand:- start:149 stop:448 length:300 start_codon:yes stop_codon:yes gene_type:complete